MWQRFTERARKVVFYAQEEAQKFGDPYVSPEHILLGLVREDDSIAIRVLTDLEVSSEQVRAELEPAMSKQVARPSQDMTLTPRAKKVIDLAYEEARNLNNNYIGTEHLLLGLIREGEGLAGRALDQLGVELAAARKAVITLQDEGASSKAVELNPEEVRRRSWRGSMTRLSPEAKDLIVLADEVAETSDSKYIGGEHILMGILLATESPAAKVLSELGVTPELLREKMGLPTPPDEIA